jgi:proline dehydrogenase
MGKPWLTKWGIRFTLAALKMKLPIQGIIKKTIFKQFCGGETLEEASNTALQLKKYGIDVIMDYGVEGKSDEAEFEKNVHTFIRTIEFSSDKAHIPFISLKVTGFADFQLLEKVHAEFPLSVEEQEAFARVKNRVKISCEAAAKNGKMILIDAEESWIQDPIDDWTMEAMSRYNTDKPIVINTLQMYRWDRLDYLKRALQQADEQGFVPAFKVVRGAYMEKERSRAGSMAYPDPIQPTKAATDRDFNEATQLLLQHPKAFLCLGTHNRLSCVLASARMNELGWSPDNPRILYAQLLGMSDRLTGELADAGYRVAKYLPYGPVKEVLPYLLRRAKENSSAAGEISREYAQLLLEQKRRRNLNVANQTNSADA